MTAQTDIDSLYEAFETVKKPEEIFGCRDDGDLTNAEGLSLIKTELRKTSPKLIEKLVNNCQFIGGHQAVHYFLPRIFELFLDGRIVVGIPFTFFDTMKEIELNSRQKGELGQAFALVLVKVCNNEIDDLLMDWLTGAAGLKIPIKPMLEVLDHPSQRPVKQYFFERELGFNIPSSGPLSRTPEFLNWYNANIGQILDP